MFTSKAFALQRFCTARLLTFQVMQLLRKAPHVLCIAVEEEEKGESSAAGAVRQAVQVRAQITRKTAMHC